MNVNYRGLRVGAAVVAIAAYVATTHPADAQTEVTVNGSPVELSPAPIIQAGRVFVPLRGVFEQLGASVVYANGTINATGNGREISLQIGSTDATVNGQPQTIDVAPFIVGESTYVPLRFISEALGDSVSWDEADQIAAIDTGGGAATYFAPGTASYVDTAPPPIPEYDQPPVPAPDDQWQPGYWAWGSYGYYWVPGTWVEAPQPNDLWTPGYWQAAESGYNWNPGYWASAVGFYGGVNYGAGYYGHGYDGGRWVDNRFRYNTYVTRVNVTTVRNVYVDRTVIVNNSATRPSYNGGARGLQVRPTAQELATARGRHIGMTAVQRQHVRAAEGDRRLLASVNGNRPPMPAVIRPLTATTRAAGFVPVKAGDRVDPQAHVAPVRVRPVRPAPVAHAPAPRAVTAPAPRITTPVVRAPAARAVLAPVPVAHAPATHVRVTHVPAVYAAPIHPRVPVAAAPAKRAAAPAHAPGAPTEPKRPEHPQHR